MFSQRLSMALPYAILFAIAAWFFYLAGQFRFTPRGDNIGPDFWPRLALGAMMAICLVQGVRLVLTGRDDEPGLTEGFAAEDGAAPRSSLLLAAGVTLTLAYGALVTVLGFLIATFAFMVLFSYAGHLRAHRTIWLSSALGAGLIVILFQKVVYVSLPRGIPPFSHLTDLFLGLF
ncbi:MULTISPECIES: tripartite tricarboxylate transporter TctB family protein [Rhodomicrobium]|uniref:tripartite tricarboxylate transporter TctB family protein n=1 Tax=Rhodomicrobium TaxID=1068 RepID=UPI000B4B2EFC|nr:MULTISPECIES: tripartite tricarboxylate transporter TctB family protein [Rhodomicrobium]